MSLHGIIKLDNIVRTNRRSIALIITGSGELEIRAPHRAPLSVISNFVHKKQIWITKKQAEVKQRTKQIQPKNFIAGENFWFLGKVYTLKFSDTKQISIDQHTNTLMFPTNLTVNAKQHLYTWYRHEAKNLFPLRVKYFAYLHKLKYNALKISSAQQRWGSCSHSGNLNFSWRLVMAPPSVIDYVVIHELAHLIVKNHGSKFWQKVKLMYPDFATQRLWLKQHGHHLIL